MMRVICDALKAGTCAWMTMSRSELQKYEVDVERQEVAGEVVEKLRKKRSDSSTSHKHKT
ncbi:hypothetical protein BDR04DRAFT_1087902 [Suillus decipiens]|nr:hypothetical protein BDR04DRAFT_1087902 [Suillus decipiens]